MKRLSWLFLLVVACLSVRANATTVKTTPWHPVYVGIDQASGSIDGSDASVAYALRVDLRAPGIRFYTAPRQGSLNTVASTTSAFLLKYGLQAAINANFFSPCCNATNEPKTVLGFAASDFMNPTAWAVCLDIGGKRAGSVTGAMNMAGQAAGRVGPFSGEKRGRACFFAGKVRTPPGGRSSGGVRVKRGRFASRLEIKNSRGTANSIAIE